MSLKQIQMELNEILLANGFTKTKLDKSNFEKSFLSSPFSMNYITLYELLICVENHFKCSFSPKQIEEFGFHTPYQICKLVRDQLVYSSDVN